MKFLIDECLSPKLAQLAHDAGYESSHVAHVGMSGTKDWDLAAFAIEHDWTLVTENSVDFRGPANAPGTDGEYEDVALHAGLVCLNADSMDRQTQLDLFGAVLEELQGDADLVNTCLEATMQQNGSLEITRYALPVEVANATGA